MQNEEEISFTNDVKWWYQRRKEQVINWYEKLKERRKLRKALMKLIKGHYANTDVYRWSPLYVVATAWRSCDTQPFPELKTLFTARLRAIYLDDYSGGERNENVLTADMLKYVMEQVVAVLNKKGYEPDDLWLENDNIAFIHWLNHSIDALSEAKGYPIWGGHEPELFNWFRELQTAAEHARHRSQLLFMDLLRVYEAVQRGEYTFTKKEGNP